MANHIFTLEEMENIFEIGRSMQFAIENEHIEVEDSKEAFMFALQLAIEFEEEYADTEDYYNDIEEFIVDKILDRFGTEE